MERRRDVRGSEHACEDEDVRFERDYKQPWRTLHERRCVVYVSQKNRVRAGVRVKI
jgi:hypothetical protein